MVGSCGGGGGGGGGGVVLCVCWCPLEEGSLLRR